MTGPSALPRLFRRGRHVLRYQEEDAVASPASDPQAPVRPAVPWPESAPVPEPAPQHAEPPPDLYPAAVPASPYQSGAAVLADRAEWQYLLTPGAPVRPATEAEAAEYARRPSDPSWAPVYRPADRIAGFSDTVFAEPAPADAPAPVATAVPAPSPDATAVMPVAEQLTEVVEAVTDEGDA